jgi:hypothetical protein
MLQQANMETRVVHMKFVLVFVLYFFLLSPRLLFFAADESLERDLVVYNITSGEVRTLYNANSSSIRLTIDRLNQIIYWISYNTESNSLMLRKTDYNGNTTVITGSFAQSGRPAITQIGDYYYVLDSTESIIRKYDKATDTVVQNITVYGGATEIIGTNGKCIVGITVLYQT